MSSTLSQRGGHHYSSSREKAFVGIPHESHQVMTGCGRDTTVRLQVQTPEDKCGCPHRVPGLPPGPVGPMPETSLSQFLMLQSCGLNTAPARIRERSRVRSAGGVPRSGLSH